MQSQPEKTTKKPYDRPRLVVYGDVRLLTQSTLTSTTGDNQNRTNNKRFGT